jgi:hypothetical protein
MNAVAANGTDGAQGVMAGTAASYLDHADYSWLLLGVVAFVLLVSGLHEIFCNRNSKKK